MNGPLLLVHVPRVLKHPVSSGKGMALVTGGIRDELMHLALLSQVIIPGMEGAKVGPW